MKKELQLLGLTKNESMVYETLVKHGPSKAGSVIGKLNLHRNLIYRALEGLVENGYATKVVRNGVWHFETTDPESLLTSSRRREKLFRDVVREITYYKKENTEQIVTYEGVKSFRAYWMNQADILTKKTALRVAGGNISKLLTVLGPEKSSFVEAFNAKNISLQIIYFGTDAEKLEDVAATHKIAHVTDSMLGNFIVLPDRVVLQIFDDRPRIIEMKDAALVSTFKHYFDLMWEKAEAR